MLFNSLNFLFFFPVVILLYFVWPEKHRYIWLLISSYYFYMCWNAKYALLLLLSTVVTYLCGLLLNFFDQCKQFDANRKKWKKVCVAGSFVVNLSILFFFKYFNFAFTNLAIIAGRVGIHLQQPVFEVLLPVGISFYTFQALGYTVDVYRGDLPAEKNFLKYALFVSFFPQLVAGPIERSRNLLRQIHVPTAFRVENARTGLLTMAYGLVLKMVIADNIAVIIDPILLDYASYPGMTVAMCIVLFAFQIYCDFHGYTQIAIGSAEILGFHLQENFSAPYLSGNIKEFWRNWHISLTTWFTDYLYIPLGGNRKGTCRKYINTMIVFLCSGLWHGASWNFVVWGGLNGVYLVIYDATKKLREKISGQLHIDKTAWGWKIISRIGTFLLADYAWLYFRARGLRQALQIQKHILQDFHLQYIFTDGFLAMFGGYSKLLALLFSLLLVFAVDFCRYKHIDWKKSILDQQIVYRWFVYLMLLFLILFFGMYGVKNAQTQFIYFQF